MPIEESIAYAAPTVGHRSSDQIFFLGSGDRFWFIYAGEALNLF